MNPENKTKILEQGSGTPGGFTVSTRQNVQIEQQLRCYSSRFRVLSSFILFYFVLQRVTRLSAIAEWDHRNCNDQEKS